MILMRSYFFCCSVRLGVIIVGTTAVLNSLCACILFFVYGKQFMDPLLELFAKEEGEANSAFLKMSISWKQHYPDFIAVISNYRYIVHLLSGMLGVYGAFKLKKWLIVPLAIFEFLNFIEICHITIVLMIVLKRFISLGMLIMLTLIDTFFLLYLGYNFITCVALFQIITLVKSARYRALYGDNPFEPHTSDLAEKLSALGYNTQPALDNVHVLLTPNDSEIDVQKRLAKFAMTTFKHEIISVLPINDGTHKSVTALKWWQQQAVEAAETNRSVVYEHWQPAELIGGAHKMQANKRQQ